MRWRYRRCQARRQIEGSALQIESQQKREGDQSTMEKIPSVDVLSTAQIDLFQWIASVILGANITEVYSPERVNEVAKRHGPMPG